MIKTHLNFQKQRHLKHRLTVLMLQLVDISVCLCGSDMISALTLFQNLKATFFPLQDDHLGDIQKQIISSLAVWHLILMQI